MSVPVLEARVSPLRTLLLVGGALLFVALGLWMVGLFGEPPSSRRYSETTATLVGWLCIFFFGVCALIGAKRLTETDAQLRISGQGIYWKQWSDKEIPWAEVADVGVWQYKRQKSIILVLRDPARYPSRTLLGRIAGANRALTGGDIPISVTGLDRSFDEVMDAIESFRARASC